MACRWVFNPLIWRPTWVWLHGKKKGKSWETVKAIVRCSHKYLEKGEKPANVSLPLHIDIWPPTISTWVEPNPSLLGGSTITKSPKLFLNQKVLHHLSTLQGADFEGSHEKLVTLSFMAIYPMLTPPPSALKFALLGSIFTIHLFFMQKAKK